MRLINKYQTRNHKGEYGSREEYYKLTKTKSKGNIQKFNSKEKIKTKVMRKKGKTYAVKR